MPQASSDGNHQAHTTPSRFLLTELLMPLAGALTPRPPRQRDARGWETTFGDELSCKIDETPWYVWLSGDTRLLDTGNIDACGCPIHHWHGADNAKSATLHEACEYGSGIHIYSGTMQHDLQLPEHTSRLRLAAALHDVSMYEAAAAVGIELAGQTRLTPLAPDDLDNRADELEADDDTELATKMRHAAAGWRSTVYVTPPAEPHNRVAGVRADTENTGTSAPPRHDSDRHDGGSGDGNEGGGDGDDPGRAIKSRARKALLHATEPMLLDAIFCTPELAHIREQARLAMESPMVKLMADLSACLSLLPPIVTLSTLATQRRGSLNLIHAVVGRSGAGKGGATSPTFILDRATGPGTIPSSGPTLPAPRSVGSGEAIAGLFAYVETDKEGVKTVHVHTESARVYWSEITKLVGAKSRQGSTLAAELCQAFSGEELGSDTKTNTCFLGAHAYRFTATIGAQLATIGQLYDPQSALMGLSQRLWLVSAELTELPAEGTDEWEQLMDTVSVPNPVRLKLHRFKGGDVPVDPQVAREVRILRYRNAVEEETDELELETHTALIRLKLAVAAAMRHGEPAAVTQRWWRWTEHLLEHHRRVRRAGQIASRIGSTADATEQGRFAADMAEARDAAQHARAVEVTLRWARKRDRFVMRDAKNAAKSGSYRRTAMEDIIAALVSSGDLVEEIINVTNHGDVLHYRATGSDQ